MLFLFPFIPNCKPLILTRLLGHYLTLKLLLELELCRGSEFQEDNTIGVFVCGLSATERSLCDKEDFTYRMGPGTEQILQEARQSGKEVLGRRADCVS